ncbi:2'-5'-oligoadenylate synthase 1-like [Heptranchias perlo]|uniref:2'-5'-oligoadenylate synthase 1-like n=1 Tax=Heptranchias perlo TaxID=212740 RepID=UPI003559B476
MEKMELYSTEHRRLDNFIKNNLEPNKFNIDVRNAVHRICEFLKTRCFIEQPEIKVIKAVKAGSTGKGTALRNGSDADLVVFLSCFQSFQDQRDTRHEILQEIHQVLEECLSSIACEISDISINRIWNSGIPPRSMSFTVKSKKNSECVEFDVLPAFDPFMGQDDKNEAHLKLINFVSENEVSSGEFSACFTELQKEFVKQRTSKLKDLIRLLKYWYKKYVKPRKSELGNRVRLPAKYAVELLTIYAWEQGNHQERFVTAEGFRTVLELICRYRELCIYWPKCYNVNNKVIADFLLEKLRANRPILLDPADPTGNVASSAGWQVMVNEARKCLSMPCVSGVQGWAVEPVKEFGITVIGLDGSSLQQNANLYSKISMIKQQIEQHTRIPVQQQRLIFNKTILIDNKTLLDSGIFFDATLHLLMTNEMEIFVKKTNGQNLTLNVQRTDTVLSLKNKIESLERLRSDQYYLTFESRQLEDGRTLEYYGIKPFSTIFINLRLRGGREVQLLNAEHHN